MRKPAAKRSSTRTSRTSRSKRCFEDERKVIKSGLTRPVDSIALEVITCLITPY